MLKQELTTLVFMFFTLWTSFFQTYTDLYRPTDLQKVEK